MTSFRKSLLSSLMAFLGYGSWASYANFSHGLFASIKAGLVQGSYSFTLTLFMTLLLEWLFFMFTNKFQVLWAAAFSAIIVCSGLYFFSWYVNWLAMTPEIFMTILPGYVIGTVYVVGYLYFLLKRQRFG